MPNAKRALAALRADELVLRLDDLPGGGWEAVTGDGQGDGGPGQVLLDRCLGAFVEGRVVDASDSLRFLRPPAQLAYSTAILLDSPDSAHDTFVAIGSQDFARCFADAVAADVEVSPGGAELLGALTRLMESEDGTGAVSTVVHRTIFSGGTKRGLTSVNVDLVALRVGSALVFVWLADAPDPFPDGDRRQLVHRLTGRLSA